MRGNNRAGDGRGTMGRRYHIDGVGSRIHIGEGRGGGAMCGDGVRRGLQIEAFGATSVGGETGK